MVQLKMTQFKTGALPSPKSYFKMNNLSCVQKMELVRCRIWGNTIGDNFRSGKKIILNQIRCKDDEKRS